MVGINADPKALPEGNQAPQEKHQARYAEQHSGPRDDLGMEKLVRADVRPMERGGEQDIEIERRRMVVSRNPSCLYSRISLVLSPDVSGERLGSTPCRAIGLLSEHQNILA